MPALDQLSGKGIELPVLQRLNPVQQQGSSEVARTCIDAATLSN
jgi:hypothetical protein